MVKIILAHIEKQVPSIQELQPDVPAELSAVVGRLLAKDPAQRFQTPVELAHALLPFIKQGTRRVGLSLPSLAMPLPERGTVLGANTSKILKPRGNPAGHASAPAAATPDTAAAPLADLGAPAAAPKEKRVPPGPVASTVWYRRPPLLIGARAGLVILGLGARFAAGVIFKVKTKDGVLVIEVNEPNPTVSVDGARVAVAWDNAGKKAEVRVRPGTHQVRLRRRGG